MTRLIDDCLPSCFHSLNNLVVFACNIKLHLKHRYGGQLDMYGNQVVGEQNAIALLNQSVYLIAQRAVRRAVLKVLKGHGLTSRRVDK